MTIIKNAILGMAMFLAVGAAHAEMIAPDALIKNTVEDLLKVVKQDKDIQAGDQKKIIALVEAKVLPHFDFTRMTQLAVAKYWRTATPEQKQALVTEFRNMLVRTYTKVFTVFRDQKIEIKPLKMAADDTEVTVKSLISQPGSPTTAVEYEMKKSADGWKVFDITIDGVSMVMSYRGTFASKIEATGIDGLIKTLSDKNIHSSDMVKADPK